MISAVILSGGHSRRMGRDKAGLMLEGQTFLERIAVGLDDILDLYLSVGEEEPYFGCRAVHIHDDYKECGPLGGIHKALSVCKHEYLFVTGCDMPFMDGAFAFYLTQFLENDTDAVVPVGRDGRKYVVGAIYHKRVKDVIKMQLEMGDRKLTHILEKIRVVYVKLWNDRQEHKLMNVNHPGDYKKLSGRSVPVMSFIGYSNTGKTTLIQQVISILKKKGFCVAYIKHTHHEIAFPPDEKDSERMRRAGAAVNAVISSDHTMTVENREVDIHEMVRKMEDVDLILIEGYKQEDFPKIMVAKGDSYPVPAKQCAAVVSDVPTDICPWFSRDDWEGLGRFIINFFRRTASDPTPDSSTEGRK